MWFPEISLIGQKYRHGCFGNSIERIQGLRDGQGLDEIQGPGTFKYDEGKKAIMGLEQLGVTTKLKPDEPSYWTSCIFN